MATVRGVALISRETIEYASLAGAEALLMQAAVLSEGQHDESGHYFGSTMLTIDLSEARLFIADACDVSTAHRLSQLWPNNSAVVNFCRAIAHREASRIARSALKSREVDIRVRAEGCWIFVDMDVEAAVDEIGVNDTSPPVHEQSLAG